MLSLFRNLFPTGDTKRPDSYQVFLDVFDEEVSADEMLRLYKSERQTASRAYDATYQTLAAEIAAISAQAMKVASQRTKETAESEIAISTLIDHSGSMRGSKLQMASILADTLGEFCQALNLPFEILGFTTVGWRGEPARMRWFGKKFPGRLCALRHIVYRSFDDTKPLSMKAMFLHSLLKENVDGEAIQWAAKRLQSRDENRKVLIVLSDGAPVDDSTLQANWPSILNEHLIEVIDEVSQMPDFSIGAIGIGYDVSRYYADHCNVQTLDEIETHVFPFVAKLAFGAEVTE